MPELPEVETTLQGVKPHVLHQQVITCHVHNGRLRWPVPADLAKRVEGQEVIALERRGKYIIMTFKTGHVLWHLGMSGSLRVLPLGAPLAKHDHLEWAFLGHILRFNDPRRFGCVLWHEGPWQSHPLLQHLGPEPLSEDFTLAYCTKSAQKHSCAVKLWIMNAKVVVGVGNIYANEALFKAGIHPLKAANQLTRAQLERLRLAIVSVLGQAITQGGTTLRDFVGADGKPGYFAQALSVYGRAGQPCVTCAKPLTENRLGNRSTVFCERCQC